MPNPIDIKPDDPAHVAALKRAVNIAGGQKPLADKMRPFCKRRTPSQQLIWNWLERGTLIEAEWWPGIEGATDLQVTRRDIRPDVFSESAA